MNDVAIITYLQNAGITVFGMDDKFVYFQDPGCVLPAFDAFFDYGTVLIFVLIALMLFGWGVLYIKNGAKINEVFKNFKSLILVFCVFALVKPITSVIYGGNLFEYFKHGEKTFAKMCETKSSELSKINELLDLRNKKFKLSDEYFLSENFSVTDTGAKADFDKEFKELSDDEIFEELSDEEISNYNATAE